MEVNMSSTDVAPAASTGSELSTIDMKLEVVTLPVSDYDRAKNFYLGLGWRLDIELDFGDGIRAAQVTPPHSPCSIQFGGPPGPEPGSVQRTFLVVDDIDAARADLLNRGVEVSEVQNFPWGSFVFFEDPDGNGWAVQQLPER
jgi:catechol 2,3-dioxygenase-like lactoylglutathione lyase family enzyme